MDPALKICKKNFFINFYREDKKSYLIIEKNSCLIALILKRGFIFFLIVSVSFKTEFKKLFFYMDQANLEVNINLPTLFFISF